MTYLPAKGLVTDLTWFGPGAPSDATDLALLHESGAQWTRIDSNWANIETAHGVFDAAWVAELDSAVEGARAAGAAVLLLIDSVPQWASGSANIYVQPTSLTYIADHCTWLARRYEHKVHAFEVWNEPNIAPFWPSGPSAAAYVGLLKACYDAIKAVNVNYTVLFAGLSQNDYAYLEACYAVEPALGGWFDVLATHPYTAHGQAPEVVTMTGGRIDPGCFRAYLELFASMAAAGDHKPIWLTEFGWSTCAPPHPTLGGVSMATQAEYLTRAFAVMHDDITLGGPAVAIVYALRGWNEADLTDWVTNLGITDPDFALKPAFSAFQALPEGPPPPPPPGPSPPAPAAALKPPRPAIAPHYRFPLQFTPTGPTALVEQDADDEIAASLATLLSWPQGTDPLKPDFGVPEAIFIDGGPDLAEIREQLAHQEPRAMTDPTLADPLLLRALATVEVRFDEAG